jgi:hypothetical protein
MHTLVVLNGQSTVKQDTALAIFGVDVVVAAVFFKLHGGSAGPVFVDGPVFAAIGVGH